jgi:hypothetical protein
MTLATNQKVTCSSRAGRTNKSFSFNKLDKFRRSDYNADLFIPRVIFEICFHSIKCLVDGLFLDTKR